MTIIIVIAGVIVVGAIGSMAGIIIANIWEKPSADDREASRYWTR